MTTVSDDCDIPYLTKSSVKDSLAIKLKAFGQGSVTAYVETDNGIRRELGVIPLSSFSFDNLDFSGLTALGEYITAAIPEEERGWIEKRISLYTEEFCSPFGVYSVSFRYKIKGKIK